MSEQICQDCEIHPGGAVVIRGPDGAVKWRRVLCEWCFHVRRRNTEAAGDVAIRKVKVT